MQWLENIDRGKIFQEKSIEPAKFILYYKILDYHASYKSLTSKEMV